MEVLIDSKSPTPVLLPNIELLELLEKDVKENKKHLARKKGKRNPKNKFEHRDWIQEHVLEYLKGTPCVNLPFSQLSELKSKCTKPSSPPLKKKRARTNNTSYGLTEAETIQILNFMPQEPVEIHLMIEDLHDRMSEAKQEEFLGMIRSYNTSLDKTESSRIESEKEDTVVDDSIELLEKAGNLPDDDGDALMKVET